MSWPYLVANGPEKLNSCYPATVVCCRNLRVYVVSMGGLPSAKSPCFLCPWSGQRTQVCTTLIQMSGELWAMAPSSVSPPSPSLIQPASPLLSSDQADALCPPHIRSGCALCWDCCSPHVTPLLTAFSLCSVRPPRPLTCFCDLTSQHLQPLGFFFFSCC